MNAHTEKTDSGLAAAPRTLGQSNAQTGDAKWSNPSHTPGPWRNLDGSIRAMFEGESVQLAALFRTQWSYPDQNKNKRFKKHEEADADLISAAPDLLEALKQALSALRSLDFTSVPIPFAQIEAAINKAHGLSPDSLKNED